MTALSAHVPGRSQIPARRPADHRQPRVVAVVVLLLLLASLVTPASASGAQMAVGEMTVERRQNPLGVDAETPRLSWELASEAQDQRQTAYQVAVATSGEKLSAGVADVWDSGKVASGQSVDVAYGGPALRSQTAYFWRVRVWDAADQPTDWSPVSHWETALVDSDWHADWIGGSSGRVQLDGASWIWYPEQTPGADPPAESRYFRRTVEITDHAAVTQAQIVLTADDAFQLWVNGQRIGASPSVADSWKEAHLFDIADVLQSGANTIAIAATNGGGPAGLIGRLRIDLTGRQPIDIVTDASWKVEKAQTAPEGWQQPGYDDAAWPAAHVLAAYGGGPWTTQVTVPSPLPYLRHGFSVDKPVAAARLYVTALGFYEARLNGQVVTEDLFTPGFTDFNKRVQYQTYDVTDLLQEGANAIGALLANGWYAGYIPAPSAWQARTGVYGDTPWLYAQLRIDHTDGTTTEVTSDASWTTAPSHIRSSDIYMGEALDARHAKPGWDTARFDDSGWQPVEVDNGVTPPEIDSIDAPSVRVDGALPPVTMTQLEAGRYVFDFGQNIAGWVRLRARGPAGSSVVVRHAEVLNPDGTLYTGNLRFAKATDTFTLAGSGDVETFEPTFTYHGFRYIEVTGFPGEPTLDSVTGVYAGADLVSAGRLATSDPLINQLQTNIEWTQNNAFWSFPTDCHQRDERLPWVSGDIQQFIPTALFNVSANAYFADWMNSVEEAQRPNGAFPDSAPDLGMPEGNAGWGDAGVIIPYVLWKEYGDTRVISDHWDALERYLSYLQARSPGNLAPGQTYGDWLHVDDPTPHDVIATAYFAHVSNLMSQMATAIGEAEDAARYRQLFEDVRRSFNLAYVLPDGTIKGNSQTAYVMALSMDLLPETWNDLDLPGPLQLPAGQTLREAAVDHLVASIRSRGMHLSTGFLGTAQLLPVLTEAGHADIAYALIQQTTYPSWGYQIELGATTVWEHWDSIKPDGSFESPIMNSFNHYGIGGVGEWMYESIGGISQDPASEPGYKEFVIRPVPGGGLTHADVSHDTPYGTIVSRWQATAGEFSLHVEVPVNTTATVHVPAPDAATATVAQDGAVFLGVADGYAVYSVGSGWYDFTSRPAV